MLKINPNDVEILIQDVAERLIQPRFKNLHIGDIKFKSGDDPVTIADNEAESELTARLLDLLPGSKVVGEEAFAADSKILSSFSGSEPVWIIDPLDGTKAFVASDPVYGVIVALAEQNQTVAGWLYDPTSKEFVTAERGAGAYYKGKKLSVLPPDRLENMAGIFGPCLREACQNISLPFGAKNPETHWMLSACHDFAALAVGEPHFARRLKKQMHFHATHCICTPWDMAAGILIHEEAGGYSAHWDGEAFAPSHYGKGILSAPDKESWHRLKDWIKGFCPFPKEEGKNG